MCTNEEHLKLWITDYNKMELKLTICYLISSYFTIIILIKIILIINNYHEMEI